MKESGRDYLNVLVHTMPKYMDNIFISAKIQRFNFQDNQIDNLKLIILKVLFYCFTPSQDILDIQIFGILSLTHEDANSAASHMNDRMSSIFVLRSNAGMLKYSHPNKHTRKRA